MSLGENINRLRSRQGMSQGDLAEALEVSRQSVSKWETDASVPELEKLIKLSELFGVTLDQLVTGKEPEQTDSPKSEQLPPQIIVERPALSGRKVAGVILLSMAFITVLLCTLMGDLLVGLVLCVPFLLCGLICFWAKKRPGLWCAWALILMADGYLRWGTGLSWATIRLTLLWEPSWNYTRLAIAWVQFLCGILLLVVTAVKLGKEPMEWTKRNKSLCLGGAAVFLLLCLPLSAWIFQVGGRSVSGLVTFVSWLQDSLRLILLTALLTAVIRGKRKA